MLACEKRVLAFALGGQGIEADKRVIDKAGMTHDETALRQAIEELPHQRAEIRLPGEVIGAGEGGVERDVRARSLLAKLRTEDVEHQRLGRAEPLCQRLPAPALTNPGAGRGFPDGLQKCVADLRKQL